MANPAAESTAPQPDDLRRRIVAAARAHFLAHGIRSVTMDDLARELAVSKKTLYAHFASKDALLEAVILEKIRSIDMDLARVTSECSDDFLGALEQLLGAMHRQLEEFRPPFRRDMQRTAPEMFELVEQRRKEVIRRHFHTLLVKGQSMGVVRRDVQVELVIELLLGAAHAIMNPRKLGELGLTPNEGFSAILGVLLEGVLTRRRAET